MSLINNYISSTKVSEFSIPGQKYSVKIASDRTEVEKALRLRFEVFNIELGEGLDSSFQTFMDEDEYDQQCHHLLVIENSTSNVIGTYRIQDDQMAAKGNGFYTEQEFDISQFPEYVLSNSVELGRACIHRDHRSGRVLYLLWRGLARYLALSGKRFLFGCCSITSQNPAEGEAFYHYLKQTNAYHSEFLIDVQPKYKCINSDNGFDFNEEVKLPQLFKLYIELGTKVCSKPALDTTFKTIDFLILLDKEGLSEQSKALFLR
jgi:putative hemolysin